MAAIGATVVFLWPSPTWEFDIGKLVAAGTALVLWLGAEFRSSRRAPSEHDLRLFEKFRAQYTANPKDVLRDHDFQNSFSYSSVKGLNEIAYWDDASHEYIDKKLQDPWNSLQQQVSNFTMLVAKYSAPVNGNTSLASVHPSQGNRDFPADWVMTEIDELNQAARSLFQSMESFERLARTRLRL